MFRILLTAVSMVTLQAAADTLDWGAAGDRVEFQGGVAYIGCAKQSSSDEVVRKIALSKALSNQAHDHNVVVYGVEKLHSDGGTSSLQYSVVESSRAVLNPPTVLRESVVVIDGERRLCVLISGE